MNTERAVFHQGEIAIQRRLGVAERMNKFGRQVIRNHMPEQHQQFYQQLPMVFAGFNDADGNVWASVLAAEPGFIEIRNDRALSLHAKPLHGDPLESALDAGSPLRLGMLGIELETRRRNRLSAVVNRIKSNQIELDVVQTFGNCPQYIQSRTLKYVGYNGKSQHTEMFRSFTPSLQQLIRQADTFFVASSTKNTGEDGTEESQGADVSHRGGKAGFVSVDDEVTLTIPDYMGNNHFNTLGNFVVNPSAGLLFIDFESGDVITMTGTAEILWQDDRQAHFKGAERLWRFTLEKGYVLKTAMPYRFNLESWSPNSLMTGTWAEAVQAAKQQKFENQWLNWHVEKTVSESDSIKSFYFKTDSGFVPDFKPGQFLTIKVNINGESHTRNYSISGSPLDDFIRISVKRDGLVSSWLHDNLEAGKAIEVKMPNGNFSLADSDKPIVLLSAGVGITPMVSMLRHIVLDNIRTRSGRKVRMLNTFRTTKDQAFFTEINQLLSKNNQDIEAYWLLTAPEKEARAGTDFSAKGRLSKEILQAVLPLGIYEFYLCGPGKFMQDTYDLLIELGVSDEQIKAEAFGPASLIRLQKKAAEQPETDKANIADSAVITFSQSHVEQVWEKQDGSLLEFAESHGLTPEFGCRGGSCGSCKVKVTKGSVVHAESASFPLEENEALLCCAKPAQSGDSDITRLEIEA